MSDNGQPAAEAERSGMESWSAPEEARAAIDRCLLDAGRLGAVAALDHLEERLRMAGPTTSVDCARALLE